MLNSAIHDPRAHSTPSQRLRAAQHLERMRRFSDAALNQSIQPMPRAVPSEPPADPIPDAMLALAHDQFDRMKMPITQVQAIQRAVLAHFPDVTMRDIKSARRTKNVVLPRQLAMYMVRKLTLLSLPAIGRRFGGRDHTTAIHAVNKIAGRIKVDPVLAAQAADIESSLAKVEIDG
jgi:chromosomal replication initiation ATPase DnaA